MNFRKNRGLYSWALYDFANTIFSALVLTFYFPLYLTGLTQRNIPLGLASALSMILAGLAVPGWGALSDQTGKTKLYLIRTTLLCVTFTLSLSFFNRIPFLMAGFLAASFFYHASLVFYHALLPAVAEPEKQGFASGIGTGLGYLGTVFAVPIAHEIDLLWGRRFVFLAAGVLFLIFSLPLFFAVPERKVAHPLPASLLLFGKAWKKVFETLRSFGRNPSLLFFFLGNFLAMESLNTVVFWMVVYMKRVFHPSEISLVLVFLGLNASAFLFGLAAGAATDRWGAQKILKSAAGALFLMFLALGFARNFPFFIGVSLIGGGASFAGIWTAARKRVVELAPPAQVGEYFGLYNLTTKISVMMSLVFSILADRFGFQAALLSLAIPSGLGFLCLGLTKERSTA